MALFHESFEAWADRAPGSPAVEDGERRLRYGELERRANQLANYLRELGVGPERLVGVCCERSLEQVVGMLGVLKAGGAYVPLDPAYPEARLRETLSDCGAEVVLTRAGEGGWLVGAGCRVVELDGGWEEIGRRSAERPGSEVGEESLAYVIYTSGSTGKPKGAMLPHRGLANLVRAQREIYALTPADRVLRFAAVGFDASIYETTLALAAGASLHLAGRDRLTPGPWLADLLRERRISAAVLTPTALAPTDPADLPDLRVVTAAGEVCSPEIVARWAPGRRFLNAYGPTETSVMATIADCLPDPARPSIGFAITGFDARVLDDALGDVPVGGGGELALGGVGLARGYLGRPDLTAERFVPDPGAATPGARLYRTGDVVRRRPDGALEFVGRRDDQVKLRGFRIELGEVESALLAQPQVAQAAVVLRDDAGPEPALVAYVVGAREAHPGEHEIQAALRRTLPAHMVPAAAVLLPELPRTPNGKVDRGALPPPRRSARPSAPAVAPRTDLERRLARIWGAVLQLPVVGVEDDFFELGGQSLLAAAIAARIQAELSAEASAATVFEGRTVAGIAGLLAARPAGAASAPAVRRSGCAEAPLSFAQEQVWFLHRLAPDSLAYSAQALIRVDGLLDVEALTASLETVVQRHEIYRTTFHERDGRAVQTTHERGLVELRLVDLRGRPAADQEAGWRRRVWDESRRPFELGRLPLVRWTLFRLGPRSSLLLHHEHHLVHDGWSFNVFLAELLRVYADRSAGRRGTLSAPTQFVDFVGWQRAWMETDAARRQLAYWRRTLAGDAPVLDLPLDRQRSPQQAFRGSTLRTTVPDALGRRLREVCRRESLTPFMLFVAALDVVLHRYTGEDDIWLGSSMANRRLPEFESVIGMVLNTIVLRVDLAGNPSLRELLARVREAVLGAHEHHDLPFEKVVEALAPRRTASHNPLFQVGCHFHDSPLPAVDVPGLRLELDEALGNGSAKFDLNVTVLPRPRTVPAVPGDAFTMILEYDSDLFDGVTVERLARHYLRALEALAGDLGRRVGDVVLLDTGEVREQLAAWAPPPPRGRFGLAHESFEAWADRAPGSPAVEDGERRLSYGELERRANQLANYLRELGVGPERLVGVCCERSLEQVVGMLGVLKAGGAYVPLDPAYPEARLRETLSDCGAEVVLTRAGEGGWLVGAGCRVVELDGGWEEIGRRSAERPGSEVGEESLAYVMYTSGSTGKPKGAMLPHRGLANLVRWHAAAYRTAPGDRAALMAGPAFDVSTSEVFSYLGAGVSVLVPDAATHADPERLRDWMVAQRITVAFAPTPVAEVLIGMRWPSDVALRCLWTGGEALRRWPPRDLPFTLSNVYGPAEHTVVATWTDVPPSGDPDGRLPPIGRPVPNDGAVLVDRYGNLVPAGAVGELCLAGAGLARGYLRHPALTAERLVPDPFTGAPGARMYRTGDLARWRSDGALEFLGRRDTQVKIRAHRIELGEIEAALATHPAVAEAAVLALEGRDGRRLVGFVAPSADVSALALRRHLQRTLPEYMVPAEFALLERLPLTANGKVDRRRLAGMAAAARPAAEGGSRPPRDGLEEDLVRIWRRLLGVEVGVTEDFFDLGGHSMLTIAMAAEVERELGVEVPVAVVFRSITVEQLADLIRSRELVP